MLRMLYIFNNIFIYVRIVCRLGFQSSTNCSYLWILIPVYLFKGILYMAALYLQIIFSVPRRQGHVSLC